VTFTDATIRVNDVDLYYQLTGSGDPLVLVHGGWTDAGAWQLVGPQLAGSFQVLTYDRRGHSRSQHPTAPAPRRTHEDDLAALIEAFDLAPAYLVGTSYGASISLGLAARRPDLVRGVFAHEPALLGVLTRTSKLRSMAAEARASLHTVGQTLATGDIEAGTSRFVEQVLGPGMWQQLPAGMRRTFLANAPTFLDMLHDPTWADLDAAALSGRRWPTQLTDGGRSPRWLPTIVTELAHAMGSAQRHTFTAAGHSPHLTSPDEYVRTVADFAHPQRPDTRQPAVTTG
jgi:pimeloyl-ACP methyl ester carboxylesterase